MNLSTQPARLVVAALTAGMAWACGNTTREASAARNEAKTPEGYRITGPYTHENLSVFLIHGNDRMSHLKLATLQEALEQKVVRVHETGNVNQLAVENVSADTDVFIQAGDIVKGGRQDRMIAQDIIVPARSGRMPLASFCVEEGRWSRRGAESAVAFDSSTDQVVGNALKIAARRKADQGEVWKEVASAQGKLSQSLGDTPVGSPVSESSLQLTLEDVNVKEGADRYLTALSPTPRGKTGIVGCAFAINGKVSGVEIYAASRLFEKMWPKLLRTAAVEAIAERRGSTPAGTLSPAEVQAFIAEANGARADRKDLSPRVSLQTREADKTLLFETLDRERKDIWLHRSYLAK